MRKNIKLIFFVLSFSTVVNADYVNEQEKSYKNINHLENQLKELQLREQIQQIEIKIKNNEQLLNPPPPPPPPKVVPKQRPRGNTFSPSQVKLLYLIGSGMDRAAVISYRGENHRVNNGTKFRGWTVRIQEKTVVFNRGSQNITL